MVPHPATALAGPLQDLERRILARMSGFEELETGACAEPVTA